MTRATASGQVRTGAPAAGRAASGGTMDAPAAGSFHVAADASGWCLLLPEIMQVVAIDEKTATLLADVETGRSTWNDGIRGLLDSQGIDLDPAARPPRDGEHPAPRAVPVSHIALFLTDRCDLRCVYCYERGRATGRHADMTAAMAERAVDWLFAQSGAAREVGISFFGGEPLLNVGVLETAARRAEALAAQTGKSLRLGMTTNGTHLDERVIDLILRHGITTVVSLDGDRGLHDRQRPRADGRGSHDDVLANARRLLAADPGAVCRATLLPGSDARAVRQSLTDAGFGRVLLSVASLPADDAGGRAATDEWEAAVAAESIATEAREVEDAVKHRDTAALKRRRDSSRFLQSLEQYATGTKRRTHCGAGRGLAAVTASGEVYPCQRFAYEPGYRVGSVTAGPPDRSVFHPSLRSADPACRTCHARYTCAGGCPHDNLVVTGSLDRPAPQRCAAARRENELAALVRCRLSEADLEFLFSEDVIHHPSCRLDLFQPAS